MTKEEKEIYLEEINDTKFANIEEMFLVAIYCIKALFFNRKGLESFRILNRVIDNLDEEEIILDFLKKNMDSINTEELEKFLDKLCDKNEELILNSYDLLDNITDEKVTTLVDNLEYRKEAYGLTLDEQKLNEYLNFTQEFWNFIKTRIIVTDDKEFHGVHYKTDESNIVKDLKIIIPKVVNLQTAKIYIHEMKHAYDIYNQLENKFEDKDYEIEAKNIEEQFENKYIVKKVS